MKIIEFLKQQEDFVSMKGATPCEVKKAEKKLGLSFAEDFKEYVLELGACCANGHELMGVTKHPQINVVETTTMFRKNHIDFPKDLYMVERLGVDGICLFQNVAGEIFAVDSMGNISKSHNCLMDLVQN